MHADAGRCRRRRILLLMPRTAVPQICPAPEAEVSETPLPQEIFSALAGDSPARLCIEDSQRRLLRECPLNQPCFQIGRSPHGDLRLNHPRIELHHLALFWLHGTIYFNALSPTAELVGPRGRITSGWWIPGQFLRIGPFRIGIKGLLADPPEFDPRSVAPEFETELPRPELRFLGSAPTVRPWPLTRPLTLIGSSPLCKVRLDDDRILPVQAALMRTAGRLWLVDLTGEKRTCVNGEPVASTPLDVGDVLRFGEFVMEIHSSAEWPPAPVSTSRPSAAKPSSADLDLLMRQLTAQHQQLLDAQRRALASLDRLARQPASAAQVKAALDEIRESYRAISSELPGFPAETNSPHEIDDK